MNVLLKILKLTAILFISLIIILFSASLLMQNKVADIILGALNKNLSTKIEIGSFRFSLLKKFPKASMELKDVLVHSSSAFDPTGFPGTNTDTLLASKFVSIEFRMRDIIKGNFNIERIGIKSGYLNLFRDSAGLINYDISWNDNNKDDGEDITLNINRINLTDVRAVYYDLETKLTIKGTIRNGRLKTRISGDDIDFDTNSEIEFDLFQLYETRIEKNISADLEVNLRKSDNGTLFRKGILSIESWDFLLTGFISSDNVLDLDISGQNIDIAKIINYFPEKYLKQASEYRPSGILKIHGEIKGPLTKNLNPHVEVTFSLNDAHVRYGKSNLRIDNFSFNGFLSNGTKNRFETSSFLIRDFTSTLGSAEYRGSFLLSDFTKPKAELILKGVIYPAELKEFFNLQYITRAGGSIDLDLRLSGTLEKKENYKFTDLFCLNSESVVNFKSFGIESADNKLNFEEVNGDILFSESTSSENLQFKYKGQKIKMDGEFRNFPEWLAGYPVTLTGSADVSFASLKPELFFSDSVSSDNSEVKEPSIQFPRDVILDVNFNIDSLVYKSFSAEKISGTLSYKPRLLNFKTLDLNSQGGRMSGNGLIVQNPNKSFISRGSFSLTDIDVNEAFITFHNFGQDFMKAENITGSLSGSISFQLPFDSLLNPAMKSVIAEGKYNLVNGSLVNFDPVKQLSSFIALSELENIRFDQLQNDFFIRNNFFYAPQMEVKSSAVDLSVNGKHSFDNNYEYHVKMLLSEILSNKARENRTVSSEFGEVEDDGLGRTSIFLKIIGNGDDAKVSYDMKAAGNQLKNDIRKEKETLKTILDQEYRGAKNEPAQNDKSSVKPRFRITWEGSDTLKTETEAPVVKKKNVIRNLFKKK